MSLNSTTEVPTKRKPGRPRSEDALMPARILLLDETINSVAVNGPLAVNARQICKAAGVMFAAVNYNFGSWSGLLAAATSKVYADYVAEIWELVAAAKPEPEARLRAYILAQSNWAQRMPGWSAVINYPVLVKDATTLRFEMYSEATVDIFKLNLLRMGRLVMDVRDNVVTPFDYTANTMPVGDMLKDIATVKRATSVGWSILGLNVWVSRGETGRAQVGDWHSMQAEVIDFHIDEIIRSIKADSK